MLRIIPSFDHISLQRGNRNKTTVSVSKELSFPNPRRTPTPFQTSKFSEFWPPAFSFYFKENYL